MKEQVFSRKQMLKLIELGMDVSDASMYRNQANGLYPVVQTNILKEHKQSYIDIANKHYKKGKWLPTYTFYDAIRKVGDDVIVFERGGAYFLKTTKYLTKGHASLISSAFELLRWYWENLLINNK